MDSNIASQIFEIRLLLYAQGGYIVKIDLMDKDFYEVKEHLPFLELNKTAARERVAEIQRELRHVKERVRGISSKLCSISSQPWYLSTQCTMCVYG